MLKPRLLLLIAAALIAAACNLNSTPPSPPATATDPPTPAPTPTATIPPTPTIAPAVSLHSGDGALLDGDFDAAVSAYLPLIDQAGADPQDRAAAAYGLAQASLRQGAFADALDALTTLIDQFPSDPRIPEAHYLRGEAELGLSRWNDALADFQAFLSLRPGVIDSYAEERIADALIALGQTDAALASYNQAASDSNRSASALLALRARVARIDASDGQTAEAVAQDDAILKQTQDRAQAAQIALQAAQTLVSAGDMQDGLVRMMQVFTGYPERPEAYQAMNVLLQNNVGLDDLAHGTVCFNYGDYLCAISALNKYAEANVGEAIPASMLIMLGRAYREIGNTQAALTAFQTIIDQYPTDPLFGDALLEQAQTHLSADDPAASIEQYMKIASDYNYLPQAAEALLQPGSLYAQENQPQQAQAVFDKLADSYPGTTQAISGLFMAASLAYNASQPTVAERYYAEISVKTSGDDQAAAYFWVGRLALERSDQKTAGEAFAEAVKAAPDSYFAARARDVVAGIQPFAPPAKLNFQFDDAGQIAQAEDWLRTTFGITQSGSLAALSPDLQADARLVRGRELWQVGEYEDATAEFDDLVAANQDNPLASYQLAVYFQSLGAYKDSIVAASYVIRKANVGTLDAPPYLARLRYPADYLDLVQSVGTERGIDPLLLLAVMRYESLFDPSATGSAGELGLMQIAPGMGDVIAGQLKWPEYQQADLDWPDVSIEFGAYALAGQLQTFKNNVAVALAAYDAGAGRAQNWLDLSGSDPDQFVTAIDDADARSYVQNLYSNYTIYRALYGG